MALFGVVAILVLLSVAVGTRAIPLDVVWHALWHEDVSRDAVVIWQLRMPRTVLGVLVGAALGLAGALMQALTRNPLADPGLLGINAGASLAVVLAITLLGTTEFSGYIAAALVGSGSAALGIYALALRAPPGSRNVHLILTGAAVSASLRAATGIITMANSATFDTYRFWVVGSLNHAMAGALWWMAPVLAGTIAVMAVLGPQLNALALGDDLVRSLGVRLLWVRGITFLGVVLLCGVATAAAGPISFAGLIVPQLVRLVIGPDWRWVLPYSLLTGAALLLAGDILGRVIARPGELEVGIVIAFIGAPLLFWLVARRRHPAG